jgi:hypothetical protein
MGRPPRFPPCGYFRPRRQHQRGRFRGRMFLSLQSTLDHHRAQLIVVIEHLTVQTLDAFVRIDVAFGMDGLHWAFVAAALARVAAFAIAPQPVEHAQPCRQCERGAKWTEIAAEHPLHSQARCQDRADIEEERPAAREVQDDGGLERLYLSGLLCCRERAERDAEQHQEDDVFDRHQPRMNAERDAQLRYADKARRPVQQFLQCAERA